MTKQTPYIYALAAIVLMLFSAYSMTGRSVHAAPNYGDDHILVFNDKGALPEILSSSDKERYQTIFATQAKANWKEADSKIGKLSNPLLLGYVLADRYLHKDYVTSPQELSDWLAIYADHPQAQALHALAKRKGATVKNTDNINKSKTLRGYGDDNGLAASFKNSPHFAAWQRAIDAWRSGNKTTSAKLFSGLLKKKDLPRWKVAAAAYWCHRGYAATGNDRKANECLRIAAKEPRSFYGVIARKQLGQSLELDNTPPALTQTDIDTLAEQNAIQRIIALVQVQKSELADKELRVIFPQATQDERMLLLSLAHELNLASVQISMAKRLGNGERMLDFARYPVPQWQPQNGFMVDRALLYALVRQESGFRSNARSPSGASGLMQIMPKTASYMKKRMSGDILLDDRDPRFNLALGQTYIKYLLENPLVEDNMLYMLTAYNAGPGRLMQWKKSIQYHNDPLLFVESIPFAETRNYVMQVMTNYWIYSELAGNDTPSTLAMISGEWPDYTTHAAPVALGALEEHNTAG